jgi:hypothetical protein
MFCDMVRLCLDGNDLRWPLDRARLRAPRLFESLGQLAS